MQPPASGARLRLQLGGRSLPVLALAGNEALSTPFRFRIELLAAADFSLSAHLGLPGELEITGADGRIRAIAGLATALEDIGFHQDGRRRVELRLESRLRLLERRFDTRIFLGRSVPQIAGEILEAHGLDREQVRFALTRSYPLRPWTLQVQESDLAFLQRILARAGIFYWSCCDKGREVLHLSDHNAHFPCLERAPVAYLPSAGLEPGAEEAGVFRSLETRRACRPDVIRVHYRSEPAPAHPLVAESTVAGALRRAASISQTRFATGAAHQDEAAQEATIRSQAEAAHGRHIVVRGNLADLFPGAVIGLEAERFDGRLSGDYVVRSLKLFASQRAGEGVAGEERSLSCEAVLIPRENPYRAPVPDAPEIPTTFSARVESPGSHVQLDEQGRYRVRAFFDGSEQPKGLASIDLRRLTPHAGPPGELPVGLHAPLHGGAEVLLSCLNGDPDRPMIVGCLPNPETSSPVTAANRSRNRYRTFAGNELCMDDAVGGEVISLGTFAGHNILELNAAALGQRIRLATEQGAMELQAKMTQRLHSGDTLTERSGGDRLQVVENAHRTETRKAGIHHQATTDIRQQAAQNIRMESGANTELSCGGRLRLDVRQRQRLTVRGPEAIFTVADGALHIQAAGEIRVTGRGGGDITFGQSGGGFVIDPAGNVRIYGKKVSLGGSGGVGLNGAVNYVTEAGTPMPAAPIAAPLPAQEISTLVDESAPLVFNLAWGRDRVPVGERIEALFSVKNFRGGETATVRICEWDDGGHRDVVDTLTTELRDGTGPCRLSWLRSRKDAAGDLTHDRQSGDTGPLEYRFEVEVDGIFSAAPSGPLWLTQTVRVDCRDENGDPMTDGTEVTLESAAGQKLQATVSGGSALFPDVVVGPARVSISGHHHRVRS